MVDSNCGSHRYCNGSFKCVNRIGAGGSCNSLGNNDCKRGLSCAGPMGTCYHKPRRLKEV